MVINNTQQERTQNVDRTLLKQRARTLRNNPSEAERQLWQCLRKGQLAGCKFRRQEVLGPYIVDFVCFGPKLIVEVDGGQHGEQGAYDEARSRYLEGLGYRVIRFWNHEVLSQPNSVLARIFEIVNVWLPRKNSVTWSGVRE